MWIVLSATTSLTVMCQFTMFNTLTETLLLESDVNHLLLHRTCTQPSMPDVVVLSVHDQRLRHLTLVHLQVRQKQHQRLVRCLQHIHNRLRFGIVSIRKHSCLRCQQRRLLKRICDQTVEDQEDDNRRHYHRNHYDVAFALCFTSFFVLALPARQSSV